MAQVRLVLDVSIDDHPRPRDRMWRNFLTCTTQVALWLWQDGTVLVMDRFPDVFDEQPPDDVAGGGYDWYGDDGSWQAQVLVGAGYTLVPI